MTKETIDVPCECVDRGCPVHRANMCHEDAATILFRIDMDDRTGVAFCDGCAIDAHESGVFADEPNAADGDAPAVPMTKEEIADFENDLAAEEEIIADMEGGE